MKRILSLLILLFAINICLNAQVVKKNYKLTWVVNLAQYSVDERAAAKDAKILSQTGSSYEFDKKSLIFTIWLDNNSDPTTFTVKSIEKAEEDQKLYVCTNQRSNSKALISISNGNKPSDNFLMLMMPDSGVVFFLTDSKYLSSLLGL